MPENITSIDMCAAKIPISLRIRDDRSESSLSAFTIASSCTQRRLLRLRVCAGWVEFSKVRFLTLRLVSFNSQLYMSHLSLYKWAARENVPSEMFVQFRNHQIVYQITNREPENRKNYAHFENMPIQIY